MGNDIRILQCLLQFIKFLRDELRVIKWVDHVKLSLIELSALFFYDINIIPIIKIRHDIDAWCMNLIRFY